MKLRNPEVRIENTSLCNGKCTICPREKMTRPKVTMPTRHFYNLVDQAVELGAETISVFGYGEPLVDRDTWLKALYCKDKKLKTFITTNATLLDDYMARKLLEAEVDLIRFSMHGIYVNDYNKVHKGLDYRDAMQNIFRFLVLNDNGFKHVTKTSIIAIPMNGDSINNIRKFWEPLVDYLEIWKPHNWAGGRNFRKVDRKRKTCGRPHSGPIQINADGKVMVCCFDTDATMTVGDTYKDFLEDIIKGDKFNEIRRKHTEGDLTGLICEHCDQLNIEEASPLLYSNRDEGCNINRTSSTKFNLLEDN